MFAYAGRVFDLTQMKKRFRHLRTRIRRFFEAFFGLRRWRR